jgi:hypothetical protein
LLNSEKETHLNLFMFMELWQLHIEEFEDTKGVIRIRKSKKNRQNNGQRKGTKEQTTIYKTYVLINVFIVIIVCYTNII